jgi:3-oxoacyl-[acyl-carrier-protein] synthase II
LGANLPQTWQALLAGKFIDNHSSAMGFEGATRFDALAHAAATQALADAQWEPGSEVALVLATSKGPIVQWTNGGISGRRGGEFGLGLAATKLAGALQQQQGIKCTPSLVISAACASGLLAVIRAAMIISSGQASRVLVIATEASVEPMFVESFRRLGILADPSIGCRPFDQGRCGFLMSEAAAAVCLQADADQKRQDGRAAVLIDRFACGAFASHLTAIEADGTTVRRLLGSVLATGPVDVIHAHGTATDANDPVELAAIESALQDGGGGPIPTLYSHKAALGHSQGAAGLISVVLNCQMHRFGQVPGNTRSLNPLATAAVRIDSASQQRPVRRSVALASGFGGAAAVVGLVSARVSP